jgi:hypothetical protein
LTLLLFNVDHPPISELGHAFLDLGVDKFYFAIYPFQGLLVDKWVLLELDGEILTIGSDENHIGVFHEISVLGVIVGHREHLSQITRADVLDVDRHKTLGVIDLPMISSFF